MMKKMIIVTGLMAVFMSGCVVHDRHSGHRDHGPKYDRKHHNKGHSGHGHGRFCPPGQAKKGNC